MLVFFLFFDFGILSHLVNIFVFILFVTNFRSFIRFLSSLCFSPPFLLDLLLRGFAIMVDILRSWFCPLGLALWSLFFWHLCHLIADGLVHTAFCNFLSNDND